MEALFQAHPGDSAGRPRRSVHGTRPLMVAFCLTLLLALPVWAAPAGLPRERDYYSADGKFVFGVTPQSGQGESCRGELFTLADGRLKQLWRHPLANRFAPAEVAVGNDGTVVTLDNWESVGMGDTVVVGYGPDGRQRFRLGLERLLSEQEIRDTVYATASSRWWRSDDDSGRIDDAGQRIVIATTAGPRAVSLETGTVAALGGDAVNAPRQQLRREEVLDSNGSYEVVGRLECFAECGDRDSWFIHLRPGGRYPQRLRLTVPDAAAAQKAKGRNVRAVVHVDQGGALGTVHAVAESLTPQRSLSLKALLETPLHPLGRQQ